MVPKKLIMFMTNLDSVCFLSELYPSRLFIPSGLNVLRTFCQWISLLLSTFFLYSGDVVLSSFIDICSIGINLKSFSKLHVTEVLKCCTSLQAGFDCFRWFLLLLKRMFKGASLFPTYCSLWTLHSQRYTTQGELQVSSCRITNSFPVTRLLNLEPSTILLHQD